MEPIPVVKKKSVLKVDSNKKSKDKTDYTKYYNPNISNQFDSGIRDDFTKLSKFVDFRDQNTENALYKPALIQKT